MGCWLGRQRRDLVAKEHGLAVWQNFSQKKKKKFPRGR